MPTAVHWYLRPRGAVARWPDVARKSLRGMGDGDSAEVVPPRREPASHQTCSPLGQSTPGRVRVATPDAAAPPRSAGSGSAGCRRSSARVQPLCRGRTSCGLGVPSVRPPPAAVSVRPAPTPEPTAADARAAPLHGTESGCGCGVLTHSPPRPAPSADRAESPRRSHPGCRSRLATFYWSPGCRIISKHHQSS